jgi:hypothetical protein
MHNISRILHQAGGSIPRPFLSAHTSLSLTPCPGQNAVRAVAAAAVNMIDNIQASPFEEKISPEECGQ